MHIPTRHRHPAPARRSRSRARTRGFTYLGALALVAALGASLGAASQVLATAQQRQREQELLFIGHQFRLALDRYAQASPRPGRRAPLALDELLQDPRFPGVRRHLRRIYVDPMTGQAEWGLVRGPDGQIHGVHSLSQARPLRQAGFAAADRAFEGLQRYSDWVFQPSPHQPQR